MGQEVFNKLHVVDISENNMVRDIRSSFGDFALDAFIKYDYVLKHVRSEKDPFTNVLQQSIENGTKKYFCVIQ